MDRPVRLAVIPLFMGALILIVSCAGPFAPTEGVVPSGLAVSPSSTAPTSPATRPAQAMPSQIPLPSPATGPMAYTALDSSEMSVCAIRTDGTIGCWGNDVSQQIAPPAGSFKRVSVGQEHACAVRADGRLACWGEAMEPTPDGTFQDVSLGLYETCALRTDGTVTCWGGDEGMTVPSGPFSAVSTGASGGCGIRTDGQLTCWGGDEGDTKQRPPGGRYMAVSTGETKSCAIRIDRTLACWGYDFYSSSGQPVIETPPGGQFRSVSVGRALVCGIRMTDEVECWGAETGGSTALTPGGRFIAVSAAYSEVCGIRVDKALVCWGGGIAGRAIPGERAGVMPDARPAADPQVLDVSASYDRTCVIRSDRSVGCWRDAYLSGSPVPDGTFRKVSVGDGQVCGIRTEGTLSCWGNTAPDPEEGVPVEPPAVPPAGSYTEVSTGDESACAIGVDKTLACWRSPDIPLTAPAGHYVAVSVASGSGCAIRIDQKVLCWGTPDDVTTPPDGEFVAIDHRPGATCGVRADGTLECWGNADHPVPPTPTGTFTDVEGNCGLRTDGTLACWGPGRDDNGTQLPAVAPPTGTFTALDDHCAIRTDGTLLCWDDRGPKSPMPSAYVLPARSWVATDDVTLRWGGSGPSPIASYDVEASWLSPQSFVRPQRWLSATTETSANVPGVPGTTYCVTVLAHDVDGFVSTNASEKCVVSPLDDRAFAASRAWKRVSGEGYYRSTALRTSKQGATLTMKVAPLRLAIVATTCPTCGVIQVSGVTEEPIIIDLRSEEDIDGSVIEVDLCGGDGGCPDDPFESTMTIEVLSKGRPVIVDGVAVGPFPQ